MKMKKQFFKGLVLSTVLFSKAFAEPSTEIKQYWDEFYTQIRQCVLDAVYSETKQKPAIEIKNTMDLRVYLKAFDYKGFVVFIDTQNITEPDVCFIRYLLNKMGYNPKYIKSTEILVATSFQRYVDAVALKTKLDGLLTNKVQDKDLVKILNLD